MGIYLGQLPPAEIARLKAELAETLIANFCYPRFFDQRTQALRMRPVDRSKRQEVWLYLSAVDFTAWNRIDLMSPEFQIQIERLLIQFVQRNRAFFGEQGRRRMSDIRTLIGSSAAGVAQGLRGHLTGQKQGNHSFGSPRPVISWTTLIGNGRSEPNWEQISATTMLLQQQLQELRGESKVATEARTTSTATGVRRSVRSTSESNGKAEPQAATAQAAVQTPVRPATPAQENGRRVSAPLPPAMPAQPAASSATLPPVASTAAPARKPEVPPVTPTAPQPVLAPIQAPVKPSEGKSDPLPAESIHTSVTGPVAQVQTRSAAAVAPPVSTNGVATSSQLIVGEDDTAIFEQMRHQLIVWLRIESVTAGIDISGQSPSQLLDLLRQQGKHDETRLQVVSTLLNLANQVIKAGVVSMLDYKQALMLHLMHTRR